MSGPARGLGKRATTLRALLACLALIAFDETLAKAQTLTSDLLRPVRDGFVLPQDLPLRLTSDSSGDKSGDQANDARLRDKDTPAPSRIGRIPTYGLPAASGASGSGFNSLNRTRKKPKLYPGQAKPKPPSRSRQPAAPVHFDRTGAAFNSTVRDRQQGADPARDGRHGRWPADAQAPARSITTRSVRSAITPAAFSSSRRLSSAPATTPIQAEPSCRGARRSIRSRRNFSPSPTGSGTRWLPISGARIPATPTPFRRRRRHCVLGADRYEPAGFPRPRRWPPRRQQRHPRVGATAAAASPPTIPAARMCRPALPNIRSTPPPAPRFGVDQNFNRLQVSAGATVDRTVYQNSLLTDGTVSSNDDRNYNQYRRRRPRQLRFAAGAEAVR